MIGCNNNIIVTVDMSQRDEELIGGKMFMTASRYSENFRLKSPAVAKVIEGNSKILTGTTIICNYNHFADGSPYLLYDNIFSIPVDDLILGYLDNNGDFHSLCGHIMIKEIEKESILSLPEDFKKKKVNHGFVEENIGQYKVGDEILWLNYSNYKVLWKWENIEKTVTVIEISEIIGRINS